MDEVDLIVVGAGPGGSSAAAAALRGGLRVAQLDAARFPRVKPCAGGLTPKALRSLPLELGPSCRGESTEFEFNAWHGRRTVFSFRAPVLSMVARPEFDNRLVAENRRHPDFVFRDGEAVGSIEWKDGRFLARTRTHALAARQLVGADGANGVVNRRFRVAEPRGRAVAVEVVLRREDLVRAPEPRPCFDFGAVPRGYGWVFPKEESLSVGLYSLERGMKDLRPRLAAYLEQKGIRSRGDALAGFEAHTIPLGGDRLRPTAASVYVVGDAAGFADALTGEGIYHALESGRIAGETAVRVARGDGSPADYARALERTVLRDTRWSWRLSGVFYRYPAHALRFLRGTPLWRSLVHGTGNGATFADCLTRGPEFWLRSLVSKSARQRRA